MKEVNKSSITHIIFDFDGLLIDTESLYTIGTQNVVSRFGKTFTWDIKAKMMGKRPIESATILMQEMQLPLTAEEVLTETQTECEKLFLSAQLMPGADRLVDHLRSHKIPMAIATGSDQKSFQLKATKHQIFLQNFHHIVYGCDPDVLNGKPAPDVFLVCASRFADKPQPHQVLVFEDAPNGVEAAHKAGMHIVMIPDANLNKKLIQNADQILNSLEDFKPEDFGLPVFT